VPVDDDDLEDDVVEEQDYEEDAADEDGEEFIVEAIKDHKFEGKVCRDCLDRNTGTSLASYGTSLLTDEWSLHRNCTFMSNGRDTKRRAT
jgi:hypothetical protein